MQRLWALLHRWLDLCAHDKQLPATTLRQPRQVACEALAKAEGLQPASQQWALKWLALQQSAPHLMPEVELISQHCHADQAQLARLTGIEPGDQGGHKLL